jgi:hypothetical protein
MDENSDEGGWGDLVASLEKRYASDSGIAEGNHGHERPFDSHPLASVIDNITRQLPSSDDYPLWRIRCKVTLSSLIPQRILRSKPIGHGAGNSIIQITCLKLTFHR